jgi:preprotein translocase subunit SecY
MLYNNKSELLTLLKRENLYTEKKLGQNFLFNTQIIEKIIQQVSGIATLTVGGTSLLIVVAVIIETVKQIDSQLVMRDYEI